MHTYQFYVKDSLNYLNNDILDLDKKKNTLIEKNEYLNNLFEDSYSFPSVNLLSNKLNSFHLDDHQHRSIPIFPNNNIQNNLKEIKQIKELKEIKDNNEINGLESPISRKIYQNRFGILPEDEYEFDSNSYLTSITDNYNILDFETSKIKNENKSNITNKPIDGIIYPINSNLYNTSAALHRNYQKIHSTSKMPIFDKEIFDLNELKIETPQTQEQKLEIYKNKLIPNEITEPEVNFESNILSIINKMNITLENEIEVNFLSEKLYRKKIETLQFELQEERLRIQKEEEERLKLEEIKRLQEEERINEEEKKLLEEKEKEEREKVNILDSLKKNSIKNKLSSEDLKLTENDLRNPELKQQKYSSYLANIIENINDINSTDKIATKAREEINTLFSQINNEKDIIKEKIQKIQNIIQLRSVSNKYKIYILNYISTKLIMKAEVEISRDSSQNGLSSVPYGAVTILLMINNPLFESIFFGVLYNYCPYTLPIFPKYKDYKEIMTEKDFKIKILKYKEFTKLNQIENDAKYIERMIGAIRLYAALTIFNKKESPHNINFAWMWLAHMVNQKDIDPISLPLLVAFLEIAAYPLYMKFKDQFSKLLQVMYENIVNHKLPNSSFEASKTKLALICKKVLVDKQPPDEPSKIHDKQLSNQIF